MEFALAVKKVAKLVASKVVEMAAWTAVLSVGEMGKS